MRTMRAMRIMHTKRTFSIVRNLRTWGTQHNHYTTFKHIPGSLMCSRCLPSQSTMGVARDLPKAAINAREPASIRFYRVQA